MVNVGLLISDIPRSTPSKQHFSDLLRFVEAAQRNGFTYLAMGQHFLYGDLRWLQPVPLFARLAAEIDPDFKLVTQIIIAPLYHPVLLAEEIATLDIVTEGRLIFGAGGGYRPEEFTFLDVPYKERRRPTAHPASPAAAPADLDRGPCRGRCPPRGKVWRCLCLPARDPGARGRSPLCDRPRRIRRAR